MREDTKEQIEAARSIIDNEFNKLFYKMFHVNSNKEVIIKNIQSRLILSEDEQAEVIKEIHNLNIKKSIGEEPSILERIALSLMFDGTY